MTERSLLILCLVAVALLALTRPLLGRVERAMVYHPDRTVVGSPADEGLVWEDVSLATEDGERLHGWWIPAGADAPVVLYLHGNAGNISHRIGKAGWLRRMGFGVLLFDWRGYGRSTGTPSEEGLARDARAARTWLVESRGVPPSRIVVWGKSLGSSVAARLAASEPCGALVLENAFTSLADMAGIALPIGALARHLPRSRFDTIGWIKAVSAPKLLVHGARDDVVPAQMGRRVHEAAPDPKRWLEIPGAAHGDAWIAGGEPYARAVREFVAEALAGPAGAAPRGD